MISIKGKHQVPRYNIGFTSVDYSTEIKITNLLNLFTAEILPPTGSGLCRDLHRHGEAAAQQHLQPPRGHQAQARHQFPRPPGGQQRLKTQQSIF